MVRPSIQATHEQVNPSDLLNDVETKVRIFVTAMS